MNLRSITVWVISWKDYRSLSIHSVLLQLQSQVPNKWKTSFLRLPRSRCDLFRSSWYPQASFSSSVGHCTTTVCRRLLILNPLPCCDKKEVYLRQVTRLFDHLRRGQLFVPSLLRHLWRGWCLKKCLRSIFVLPTFSSRWKWKQQQIWTPWPSEKKKVWRIKPLLKEYAPYARKSNRAAPAPLYYAPLYFVIRKVFLALNLGIEQRATLRCLFSFGYLVELSGTVINFVLIYLLVDLQIKSRRLSVLGSFTSNAVPSSGCRQDY